MGRTASQSTGRRAPELIPAFTFGMDRCTGLLIGVHAVNGTTGDITSIRLGVPAEGSVAATILEGHPGRVGVRPRLLTFRSSSTCRRAWDFLLFSFALTVMFSLCYMTNIWKHAV
jgi:hypothetical protein